MKFILAAFVLIAGTSAWAQSASSVNSAPDESRSKLGIGNLLRDKKFEEDSRITDLELRSYAGSQSRYSAQFSLGYSGPPVNDLSDPNKPNPDNRPGDNRTLLSGTMGLRYRTGVDTAINFGTGVKWYTPYQATTGQPVQHSNDTNTFDVADPQVSFDVTGAAGPTQLRSSVKAVYVTTAAYTKTGEAGEVGFSQYVKWNPKAMDRVIFGAQVALDYFFFNRDYRGPQFPRDRRSDGNVSRYYMNFIPSFEYKISSSVNFNTSLGYPYQNLRKQDSWINWQHQLSTWRVGAGWAITHDIYVNPYVNFFAEAPAFNTASLNMNTTFSVF